RPRGTTVNRNLPLPSVRAWRENPRSTLASVTDAPASTPPLASLISPPSCPTCPDWARATAGVSTRVSRVTERNAGIERTITDLLGGRDRPIGPWQCKEPSRNDGIVI